MSAKSFSEAAARQRIGWLFDADSFVELDRFAEANGEPGGVICGYGSVQGSPVCAFVQGGGGLGKAQAAKIAKLYDLALKTGIPVVGVYDSPGAHVSEGVAALEAYGELLLRINNLSGVVPQISLVLGDCAGSSAMLACSADFVVMSEDASFFLTPPSLSRDEAEGAGTAEAAAKSGVAHLVCPGGQEAVNAVIRMLGMLPINNLAAAPICDFDPPSGGYLSPGISYRDAKGRDIAADVCDDGSILELLSSFGENAFTALATLGGAPVGVVATNGGWLDADCCAKIAKITSVCDSFQLPVITFINTTGVAPSSKAELSGSVREMAKLAHVYAEATTAKMAVISGRAYGAAYVALASRAANSDYTIAYPDAVITALEPVAAVAFLHGDRITADKDRDQVVEEYIANDASPMTAAKAGYLDDVISPELTRPALLAALDLLSAKRVSRNPKKHGNIPM